ncbi:hypothetical protein LTS17_012884 [Exophiala oligosperma]
MDEIDASLPEDTIWLRLYQSKKVPLKRENNQEPLETGGGVPPRENVLLERGFRKSTPVLRPSTTHNSDLRGARPVAVSRATASCHAACESREARPLSHSIASPILARPNVEQVRLTRVEQRAQAPLNATCTAEQPKDQGGVQRAARASLNEEINNYDGAVEEEEERGLCSVSGKKRACASRSVHAPQKTAKTEYTPEGLAERFGTNDRGALISTLREEWQDITSSQLLPDMDTTAPIGMSQCHDVPSFVNFVLQQGRLLERNSLRGEVQSLKNRIDFAHYYQLYVAASNDTRKGADSPFLAWMGEWYRRRDRSPSLAMGQGKGASTVVKDCLVDLHLSDSRFKGVPPRSMRRRLEKWRAIGGFWSKLIEGFGPGMLLLAPSCEPDSRYEFGEPGRRAFLTALTQRRSAFDTILPEANQFMNEKFPYQFVPVSIETSFPVFPTPTDDGQRHRQDD